MKYMKLLPNEIIAIIFQYLQCPLAKFIKDEINNYENDYTPFHISNADP